VISKPLTGNNPEVIWKIYSGEIQEATIKK
jgi:hypothetical protein